MTRPALDAHVERTLRDLGSKIGLVRKYAARDLGRYRDPLTIEPLLGALADPEPEVLIEVVEALRRIGDGRAVEPLRRFARSGSGSLSDAAMRAAGDIEAGRTGPASDDGAPGIPRPIAHSDTRVEMLAGISPGAFLDGATESEGSFHSDETELAASRPDEDDAPSGQPTIPPELLETVDRPVKLPPRAIPPQLRQVTQTSFPAEAVGAPPETGSSDADGFRGEGAGADAAKLRARVRLINDALRGTDATVTRRDYGFKITVPLLDGQRRQIVRVVFENTDPEGDKVILIHSVCGKSSPVNYRWALDANRKLMYGRIALRHDKGGERFIVLNTIIEATADPFDVRKNVLAIADKADWIERQLSSVDRY